MEINNTCEAQCLYTRSKIIHFYCKCKEKNISWLELISMILLTIFDISKPFYEVKWNAFISLYHKGKHINKYIIKNISVICFQKTLGSSHLLIFIWSEEKICESFSLHSALPISMTSQFCLKAFLFLPYWNNKAQKKTHCRRQRWMGKVRIVGRMEKTKAIIGPAIL